MMKKCDAPTVSIIIASYNWSSVLHCAITSALRQTLKNFELIVVGDGCTDDSEAVVRSFSERRIQWRNLPFNSGSQSEPNNYGVSIARGRYIAYLGHDDLWHPTHLERLVRSAERTDADVAVSYCVMLGPPRSDVRVLTGVPKRTGSERHFFAPPSSILHRR
ncbi:MAG: glycosyltransferase family 2 protein, partial [Rhodoferax sp.]|nr:glycosyltransferase family 2 protein [Rhodoferax sp.]